MRKVIIGLSGGMDSTTLLAILLSLKYEVHCCSFIYGSKHGKWELKAATDVVAYYKEKKQPVFHHIIDLTTSFANFDSALLLTGGPIPEGHYETESMKQTVVPGRNLIFGAIMAGLAESIDAKEIALGVHSGDHAIYPDCRPKFIDSMRDTILLSSGGKVNVIAPFIKNDKSNILYKGYYGCTIKVPYYLTRTCYKDQEFSCGKCGSCVERLEAFQKISIKDPIKYEN